MLKFDRFRITEIKAPSIAIIFFGIIVIIYLNANTTCKNFIDLK